MGQKNLIRTEFLPKEIITSSLSDDIQTLAFTAYFKVGDKVNIEAFDAQMCRVGSPLATNLTVTSIDPQAALVLDSVVDTSTALPTGAVGWYFVANEIDDGQEAIDRLYRCYTNKSPFDLCTDINSQFLNDPIGGQTRYLVDDISCHRVGDSVDIIGDEGLIGQGIIVSLDANADEGNNQSEIVIDTLVDTSTFTNPKICNKTISIQSAIERLKEDIDKIDQPCENEFMGTGDCDNLAFETNVLFLQSTSKVFLDGSRMRLGIAGTRATLANGAGNAALTIDSMILGLDGNDTEFEMVDPAAPSSPLAITITGNFSSGLKISVSLETDGGSAIISTAKDVADAINSDANAKKLIQVLYGTDGLGLQAALVSTNLAGGLDDGTGDYAELPQVLNNLNTLTGYKWISFHIRTNESNRMNKPPRESEEITIDYRKALTNA